jgi:hypothetical protein
MVSREGGFDDDLLSGGSGNDTIEGGLGDDPSASKTALVTTASMAATRMRPPGDVLDLSLVTDATPSI